MTHAQALLATLRFALILAGAGAGSAQAEPIRISVLMHVTASGEGETALRGALEQAHSHSAAFIVVNGLKKATEACSDRLFRRRKAVLEAAELPVFLSMAGSDWINCRDRRGRLAETVWLGLLREQLYGAISWTGSKHLNLKRQSALPAFRSYSENTRWAMQQVMFATLHLPAQNNHYSTAAGRNSEFEDRLTANRDWLKRLAQLASTEHRKAIVLFSDGQLWPATRAPGGMRDGFQEMSNALRTFAAKVRVPVLLVQGPAGTANRETPRIEWRGRLAYVTLPHGVTDIEIDTQAPVPFELAGAESGTGPAQ